MLFQKNEKGFCKKKKTELKKHQKQKTKIKNENEYRNNRFIKYC